jgi:hypothetical protein
MLRDDVIDVFLVDIGVPGPFRVDHQYRPQLTPSQATSYIDPHASGPMQPQFLEALFSVITHLAGIEIRATGFTRFTLVGTEKKVIVIKRHDLSTKGPGLLTRRLLIIHSTIRERE